MICGGPYRPAWSSSWTEQEMWLRLDDALYETLRDPVLAFSIAWSLAMDAADFPEVRSAAVDLLDVLISS